MQFPRKEMLQSMSIEVTWLMNIIIIIILDSLVSKYLKFLSRFVLF